MKTVRERVSSSEQVPVAKGITRLLDTWIKLRMHINPSGMLFNDASGPQANTEDISSLPGLDGIPAPLLYLHKEVGLVGKPLGDR